MALFKFRREMFLPYFLTYIGSVAAHIYVTRYHSHMIERDETAGYCFAPIFLLLPYFIQPSIYSPYSDKTQYHCWMCWEDARFSYWDLVAFAFHLLFVSITIIERFYTNYVSMFTMIYVVIRIVVCFSAKIVHAFIVDWEMEKEYEARRRARRDKLKEIQV